MRGMTRRPVHYMNLITSAPVNIIVRTPYPLPLWRSVLKALTSVMQRHDLKQKDIFSVDGLFPYPTDQFGEWTAEDDRFAERLHVAFDKGTPGPVPTFWLYDWRQSRFVLVRKPSKQ